MTIPETTSATLRPQQSTRRTSSFAGDVLKLVSGTAFAQGLGILAMPLLTRLYGPEAFGTLAIFTSITGILGVIACMRYELAIMLPESDEEAANLLAVSLLFAVLIALLTIPLVWLGGTTLLGWLNAPQLGPYLWLVPPMVLLSGIFLALNYWNTRTKHFGRLSIARVNQAIAVISTQLGCGFAGLASGGAMIGANVGGQALATTVLGGQIWCDDRKIFLRSINWAGMLYGIKRYRKFPLVDLWSSLLNTISVQLPSLILAAFFSPLTVGFYALSYRLLNIPMSLIGGSIAQVFFQRASVAKAEGNLNFVVQTTFQKLITVATLPFLILGIIGPELFKVVFGLPWTEAGFYVQILAPWLFFVFLGSPISTLISVLEVQEVGFFFNVTLITSRFISLLIGGVLQSVELALMLFSISGTVLWIWFIFYIAMKSGVGKRTTADLTLRQLTIGILFMLPLITSKWALNLSSLSLVSVAIVSSLFYYLFVVLRDEDLRKLIVPLILKR